MKQYFMDNEQERKFKEVQMNESLVSFRDDLNLRK